MDKSRYGVVGANDRDSYVLVAGSATLISALVKMSSVRVECVAVQASNQRKHNLGYMFFPIDSD